jgi:hypothetical protein
LRDIRRGGSAFVITGLMLFSMLAIVWTASDRAPVTSSRCRMSASLAGSIGDCAGSAVVGLV